MLLLFFSLKYLIMSEKLSNLTKTENNKIFLSIYRKLKRILNNDNLTTKEKVAHLIYFTRKFDFEYTEEILQEIAKLWDKINFKDVRGLR